MSQQFCSAPENLCSTQVFRVPGASWWSGRMKQEGQGPPAGENSELPGTSHSAHLVSRAMTSPFGPFPGTPQLGLPSDGESGLGNMGTSVPRLTRQLTAGAWLSLLISISVLETICGPQPRTRVFPTPCPTRDPGRLKLGQVGIRTSQKLANAILGACFYFDISPRDQLLSTAHHSICFRCSHVSK